MMIRQALEQQLIKIEPCSGDFLNGLSYTEKVDELTRCGSNMTYQQAEQYVDQKIKEWAEHKGDRPVFVMIQHTSGSSEQHKQITLSVVKLWESEIDDFENTHHFVRMSSKDGIPVVEPKTQ